MWYNYNNQKVERMKKMKNKQQNKEKPKKQNYKGEIFVKIMAGILAVLMVAGTGITLVYALMR